MVKISDAEYEVMKIAWRRKETTSLEIIEDLKDHKWNFNTIRTLIKRLEKKGALQVSGRRGKTFTYITTIDENEYKREMTREFVRKLYNDSLQDFILAYCKANKVTAEEIQELIDYIDEKEKREKNSKEKK